MALFEKHKSSTLDPFSYVLLIELFPGDQPGTLQRSTMGFKYRDLDPLCSKSVLSQNAHFGSSYLVKKIIFKILNYNTHLYIFNKTKLAWWGAVSQRFSSRDPYLSYSL